MYVQEYEDRLGSGGIKEPENPVWGSAHQDDLNQLITKRQVKSTRSNAAALVNTNSIKKQPRQPSCTSCTLYIHCTCPGGTVKIGTAKVSLARNQMYTGCAFPQPLVYSPWVKYGQYFMLKPCINHLGYRVDRYRVSNKSV